MATRVSKLAKVRPIWNPEFSTGSNERARWCEDLNNCGLRYIGYCDQVHTNPRAIDHKGWYTSDENWSGEKLRGIVMQLPAKDGKSRYLAGFEDACNEDTGLVFVDTVYEDLDGSEALNEAAYAADSHASYEAERMREYDAKWQHNRRCEYLIEEKREELEELREELRELVTAIRKARAIPDGGADTREVLTALALNQFGKAWSQREELIADIIGEREDMHDDVD